MTTPGLQSGVKISLSSMWQSVAVEISMSRLAAELCSGDHDDQGRPEPNNASDVHQPTTLLSTPICSGFVFVFVFVIISASVFDLLCTYHNPVTPSRFGIELKGCMKVLGCIIISWFTFE